MPDAAITPVQDFQITRAVYEKNFPSQHGEKSKYVIDVQSPAGNFAQVELVQNPGTQPPLEGGSIRGHIENGQYGMRFRKEYLQQAPQPQGQQIPPEFGPAPGAVQQQPAPLASVPPPGPVQTPTSDLPPTEKEKRITRQWAINAAIGFLRLQAES